MSFGNDLSWKHFNVNFHSSPLDISEIVDIAEEFFNKVIDLRPYMIERPFCVYVRLFLNINY